MTDPYGSPPSGPSDREREGSFEAIASWYDGRMGDEGDGTHRHLLLPALSRALGGAAGLSALDLGCAGGVCGRLLAKRGARVVGLDLSPSLVALARSREETQPRGIGYLVADAASLPFPSARFARVVAHMVLMDAEDAAGIIREAARVLAPGGRFVASLLHPCFEPPQGADWQVGEDETGRRHLRRIWRYRDVYSEADRIARGQPVPITRYHRPLEWYAARLREAGLLIDTLDEPLPDDMAREPSAFVARQRVVPSFLILGSRKATAR